MGQLLSTFKKKFFAWDEVVMPIPQQLPAHILTDVLAVCERNDIDSSCKEVSSGWLGTITGGNKRLKRRELKMEWGFMKEVDQWEGFSPARTTSENENLFCVGFTAKVSEKPVKWKEIRFIENHPNNLDPKAGLFLRRSRQGGRPANFFTFCRRYWTKFFLWLLLIFEREYFDAGRFSLQVAESWLNSVFPIFKLNI